MKLIFATLLAATSFAVAAQPPALKTDEKKPVAPATVPASAPKAEVKKAPKKEEVKKAEAKPAEKKASEAPKK